MARGATRRRSSSPAPPLGLPGTARVFDDANVARLLHGEQFIDVIPTRFRHAILDKHITRLVKSDDGGGSFETIDSPNDVIKLAARAGALDLAAEFGVAAERVEAYDVDTVLAVGAGLDALRDAGIPLVDALPDHPQGHRSCPAGWALPDALRDDTGIIFASAFPGLRRLRRRDGGLLHRPRPPAGTRATSSSLRARLAHGGNGRALAIGRDRSPHRPSCAPSARAHPYLFDRRFLFRVLSMGHSQFAELIGARGPNTQINSACASTTQAFALAEDWIAAGRCRRVIVIAADDVTSDHMLEWVGAGFLASGAAATDDVVEEAALPFDRRRHGTLLGMGAAAFVIESAAAARERGVQPICEVLGSGHRQQRLPRHAPRRRAHLPDDGAAGRRRRGALGHRSRAQIAPRDGLHLARDLHPGARRQRRRRGATRCATSSAPPPSGSWSPTPRATPATRWASASRTWSR